MDETGNGVFQRFIELLEEHEAPDDARLECIPDHDEVHVFWGASERPTGERLVEGVSIRLIIDLETDKVVGLVLMQYSQCEIPEADEAGSETTSQRLQ